MTTKITVLKPNSKTITAAGYAGYNVNQKYLDKNNIENFDKFTRIIEEKMHYKAKITKIGKIKRRW